MRPLVTRIALSLVVLLPLSCFPFGEPGGAAPAADPQADVTEEDLGPLRGLAGCKAAPDTLTCRALVAFAAGRIPSRRPAPVSLPGAVAVIPAPGSPEAGQPPVLGAGYLVLADGGARFQILLPSNEDERRASQALVSAVAAGQALPADNATVVHARSRTGARPVREVGRSLAWSGDTQGFLRETGMGLVVVERAPSVILVAVFPP